MLGLIPTPNLSDDLQIRGLRPAMDILRCVGIDHVVSARLSLEQFLRSFSSRSTGAITVTRRQVKSETELSASCGALRSRKQ